MLKKVITYVDFDGKERTETFYFNLTQAEVLEMEASVDGGFQDRIQKIIEAENRSQIIEIFKKFILLAYGQRTIDGKFIKSKELAEEFSHTEAYSALFMELSTVTGAAVEFISALAPKDTVKKD